MTESCCNHLSDKVIPQLGAVGHSWIHWGWKDWCREDNSTKSSASQNAAWGACKTGFGGGPFDEYSNKPNRSKMVELAVPYAPIVAGSLEGTWWNATAGVFTLKFCPDPLIRGPSEVFLSEELNFPNGFDVSIEPDVLHMEHKPTSHRLLLSPRPNSSATVAVV